LVIEGKIEQLKHTRQKRVSIEFGTKDDITRFIGRYPIASEINHLKIQFLSTVDIAVLLKVLDGLNVTDINIVDPTLEDIFLQYYNDEI
jgi:ABC-type uncharacterized transport system ATPase subunit